MSDDYVSVSKNGDVNVVLAGTTSRKPATARIEKSDFILTFDDHEWRAPITQAKQMGWAYLTRVVDDRSETLTGRDAVRVDHKSIKALKAALAEA